jgi:hypothetical protein
MRRHEPTDITTAVARLAGQVDQLDRDMTACASEVTRLRGDVDAHSRSISDLADLVRRLHATTPSPQPAGTVVVDESPLVPDWLTVTDPHLAVTWLENLAAWTTDVWSRYRTPPGCWSWHPTVVAELLVCQYVWITATTPGMPAEVLATWHDRWLPGVARRIDHTLAACERAHGRHVTTGGQPWVYDPTVLDELAVWWATTHGNTTPPPGLTREDHP